MLFGMPTLIEISNQDKCAALCRELNLDFVELNMNLPQYQLHKIDIPYLKRIADKYHIFYTIHLDENLNISDFNPYIADAYRRTVTERYIYFLSTKNNICKASQPFGPYVKRPSEIPI